MDEPEVERSRRAVRQVGDALNAAVLPWWTGASARVSLAGAFSGLPGSVKGAWNSVEHGEVQLPPSEQVEAGRLRTWLAHASEVEEVMSEWAQVRSRLSEQDLDPEVLHQQALTEGGSARAVELWRAAREPLVKLTRGAVDDAAQSLGEPGGKVEHAEGFLRGTEDVLADALEYSRKRYARLESGPEPLLHARALRAAPLDDRLLSDAARALVRQVVQPWAEGLTLKRLGFRPLPWLGGFSVADPASRTVRTAWAGRHGVVAMLELLEHTAAGVARLDMQTGDAHQVSWLVGHGLCAGVMNAPMLRKTLALSREDADTVLRHGTLWLLLQMRIQAALAQQHPGGPMDALDALALATGSDPDPLEAAAHLGPWPRPGQLGFPLPAESSERWNAWCHGMRWLTQCRQRWDEDFLLRKDFHEHLRTALHACARSEEVPKSWDDAWDLQPMKEPPVSWFMETLG